MPDEVEGERKSVASPPDLVTDPVEVARKEASNGLRQFDAVVARVDQARSELRPFRLRPSDLLSSRLPGKPTIPDLIVDKKKPYYAALEAADVAWAENGRVDLSAMEELMGNLLGTQLISAIEQARGEPIGLGRGPRSRRPG